MRRLAGLVAWLGVFVAVDAQAESTPAKELVRFEQRVPAFDPNGKALPFERLFTLYADGKFDYRGEAGEIEESHLQVIAILLAKTSFALAPGPACDDDTAVPDAA